MSISPTGDDSDENPQTSTPPPPPPPGLARYGEEKEEKEEEGKNEESEVPIQEEFRCPVCMNLYLKPTLFECGHTFCLTCHYKLDKATTTPTFTLPVYKCPLCRSTTMTPWTQRPANITLDKVCKAVYPKEYETLMQIERKCKELTSKLRTQEQSRDEESDEEHLSRMSSVNLSQLSAESQSMLADKVYSKLIPKFIDAARLGKSHVTVVEKSTVKDIEVCIQPLSKKLFEKNNVYKITCTPEECSVFFSRSSMRWNRSFQNENHVNFSDNEPNDELSTSIRTRNSGRRQLLRPGGRIDRIIMSDLRTILRGSQSDMSDV
tara:strand:+ start:24316 stop:25275 length:960 start_codon:yes stop_codon:yes gene_type:complete